MTIRVMVTDERQEEFKRKNGDEVKLRALHCVDMSRTGLRLESPLVVAMKPEEAARFSGKVRDTFIIVEVGSLMMFGGVFKVRDCVIHFHDDNVAEPKR